jgi:hypothetical protein
MKHALIAASLVLVAGLGAGCGGGDESKPETSAPSASVSTADFCKAYNSLFQEFAGKPQPNDRQAVRAIKKWADELEQVGPADAMPADARKGYELLVKTISKIENNATQADIQKLTAAFTAEEQKSSNTFGTWAQKTCPTPSPSGATSGSPSQDSSSSAP